MVGFRPQGCRITRADAVHDSTLEDSDGKPSKLPYAMFAYRLELDEYGKTVTVDLHFSKPAPADAYWVMFDPVNGWCDYSDHAAFNQERSKVTLQLKDGGFGDCDHAENGVIVDPGGLAIPDGASGGGGCFISNSRQQDSRSAAHLCILIFACLIMTSIFLILRYKQSTQNSS